MPDTFTDPTASRPDRSNLAALPRGLVRPPQPVLDVVARERARLAPNYSDEFAKLTLDDLTLVWYYENLLVAYRSVPEGVEVLAVGGEEVGDLFDRTPPDQWQDVHVKQP